MPHISVCASVTSDNPEIVTRAWEAFGRAAIGMALEGSHVVIELEPLVDDNDTADEDADNTSGETD